MKVCFKYTKDEYKRYLIKSRKINNIITFILGIIIYLFITYKNVSIIFLPIFIIALIMLIFLLNNLYVYLYLKMNSMMNNSLYGEFIVELNQNKFSLTINHKKEDYKYNKIKKIKIYKDKIKLKLKNTKEYLTFEKAKINDKDYTSMIEIFKEKCKLNV